MQWGQPYLASPPGTELWVWFQDTVTELVHFHVVLRDVYCLNEVSTLERQIFRAFFAVMASTLSFKMGTVLTVLTVHGRS